MGQLTFIVGGARSGKSDCAQQMAAADGGSVLFIATAQAMDDEMAQRIAEHRRRRPRQWQTLELATGIGNHILGHLPRADVIVLDCLTLLVSNLMGADWGDTEEARARTAVDAEVQQLTRAIRASAARWIIVSNEVGAGIVPAYAAGRFFRDALGRANMELARVADQVIWMVAGIPVPISKFRDVPH